MDAYNPESDLPAEYNFSGQPILSLATANLQQDLMYSNQDLDDCLSGASQSWNGQFPTYPDTGYYQPQQMQSYPQQQMQHMDPNMITLDTALANEVSQQASTSPVSQNNTSNESVSNGQQQQQQQPLLVKCKRGRPRKGNKKSLTSQEEDAKRAHFLERNRVAASKCREKKKSQNEEMKVQFHGLKEMNDALKMERLQLQKAIVDLQAKVFMHVKCGHEDIDKCVQRTMANPTTVGLSPFSQLDPTSAVDVFSPDDFPGLNWGLANFRHNSLDMASCASPVQSGMSMQQPLPHLSDLNRRPRMLSRDDSRGSIDLRNDDSGISVGSQKSPAADVLYDEGFDSPSRKTSMQVMMPNPRAAKDFYSSPSHLANEHMA